MNFLRVLQLQPHLSSQAMTTIYERMVEGVSSQKTLPSPNDVRGKPEKHTFKEQNEPKRKQRVQHLRSWRT